MIIGRENIPIPGTAMIRQTCPECKGSGWSEHSFLARDTNTAGRSICTKCQGTGGVWEQIPTPTKIPTTCPHCHKPIGEK